MKQSGVIVLFSSLPFLFLSFDKHDSQSVLVQVGISLEPEQKWIDNMKLKLLYIFSSILVKCCSMQCS